MKLSTGEAPYHMPWLSRTSLRRLYGDVNWAILEKNTKLIIEIIEVNGGLNYFRLFIVRELE